MNPFLRRWTALLAPLLLTLMLSFAVSQPARAQPPLDPNAPAEEKSEGRPVDGYLGTTCLVMLTFFIVGKSARR